MKTNLIVPAVIALALGGLSGAAFAETVTITGQNGGSSITNGSCHVTNGQMDCASHTVVTGANGATGVRDRATTFTRGQITSTVSGTRLGGSTFGRTTTVTR